MNDVVSTSYFYPSIIGLVVLGAIVLGVLFLILLIVFAARGSRVSRTTGGAVALTLASMIFLTGVWSFALSPTVTEKRYDTLVSVTPSISPGRSWVFSARFEKGDTITANINPRWQPPYILEPTLPDLGFNKTPPDGNITEPGIAPIPIMPGTFSVFIYDPQDELVWSEENVTSSYFSFPASRAGDFRFRVLNEESQPIAVYISISRAWDYVYRPLEPFGQWLSLVSLPLLGLGIWATLPRPHTEREAAKSP